MWLIDTSSLQLVEFHECPVKTYAILSHTWGATTEEPTFEEFKDGRAREKAGFEKIRVCCERAKSDGIQYAWVDTCCIDKRYSTELSEAINSMFSWYQQSKVCYAYLADVSRTDAHPLTPANRSNAFRRSKWFTRGWTLQELVAPDSMIFFTKEWFKIGDKSHLAETLQAITGIDLEVLTLRKSFLDCSVAQRMSWAALRQTTRLEDIAYCLFGLFNVNLSMMYGEGSKAFLRLQQQIIQEVDDETIFAWTGVPDSGSGLLASHPAAFVKSANVQRDVSRRARPHYINTNRGLQIQCQLLPCEMNTYKVPLQCCWNHMNSDVGQIAMFITRTTNDDQYRRVLHKGKSLDRITEWEASRAESRTINVPIDSRGVELAPSKGLPQIHIRSELQIWHIDRCSYSTFRLSESNEVRRYLLNDIGSGMLTISSSIPSIEFAACVPHRTKQVQFREADLEKGIILAIHLDPHPSAEFSHYLQIGFDLDFKPVAVLRTRKFWFGYSELSQWMRLSYWLSLDSFPDVSLKIIHSFWTVPALQRKMYYWRPTKRFISSHWFKFHLPEEEPLSVNPVYGSWKLGSRSERLILDPIPSRLMDYCTKLHVSMHPLDHLDWEVQIHVQRDHSSLLGRIEPVCLRCLWKLLRIWVPAIFELGIVLECMFLAALIVSLLTRDTLHVNISPDAYLKFTYIVMAVSLLAQPIFRGVRDRINVRSGSFLQIILVSASIFASLSAIISTVELSYQIIVLQRKQQEVLPTVEYIVRHRHSAGLLLY